MKTRIAPNRVLGLSLLASALAGSTIVPAQTPPTSAPAKAAVSGLTVPVGAPAAPVANPNAIESAPKISNVLAAFLKATQGESNENALILRVKATTGLFALGADHIIYLQKLGLSGRVIIAMLEQDAAAISRGKVAASSALIRQQNSSELKQTFSPAENHPANATTENSTAESTAASVSSSGTPGETMQTPADFEDPGGLADYEEAIEDDQPELYPVRKPYPVKLSDPIIVFRAPPLAPNLVLIHPLR